MKLNFLLIGLFGLGLLLHSCKNEDDGIDLLPQEEQNQVDDQAIALFLQQHYFNAVGKVVKFSDDNDADDEETPLAELAEQGTGGYWFVKNPNYQSDQRMITNPDNDSILMQYDLNYFYAKKSNDSVYYTTPISYSSTINTTGYPIWDPSFYYHAPAEDQQDAWYEMEGIQEGLKHFNSKGKNATDLPAVDFQGFIIAPSRLIFERDRNAYGFGSDTSVMLNFELYQVIDR